MNLHRTIGIVLAVGACGLTNAVTAAEFSSARYDWSGVYIGATAGAGWSKDRVELNASGPYVGNDAAAFSALGSTNFKDNGGIFGGKVGINGAFDSWVVGLEGDWSSLRVRGSTQIEGHPYIKTDPWPGYMAKFDESISADWLATVRGRVGYAFDRVLFYGTAGVAFGNQRFSSVITDYAPLGSSGGSGAAAQSGVEVGWAAGGGVDYAPSDNWIVSLEYLHVDLGEMNAHGLMTTGNPNTADLNFSSRLDSDIVRAGLAYKFGGN